MHEFNKKKEIRIRPKSHFGKPKTCNGMRFNTLHESMRKGKARDSKMRCSVRVWETIHREVEHKMLCTHKSEMRARVLDMVQGKTTRGHFMRKGQDRVWRQGKTLECMGSRVIGCRVGSSWRLREKQAAHVCRVRVGLKLPIFWQRWVASFIWDAARGTRTRQQSGKLWNQKEKVWLNEWYLLPATTCVAL